MYQHNTKEEGWECLLSLGDGLDASMVELASELGEERKAKEQGR